MRVIVFHKRAARYLRLMPKAKAALLRDSLREVASLEDVTTHAQIKVMRGDMKGFYRLRVGSYRAIVYVTTIEEDEVLYIDAIGPRGDIYK